MLQHTNAGLQDAKQALAHLCCRYTTIPAESRKTLSVSSQGGNTVKLCSFRNQVSTSPSFRSPQIRSAMASERLLKGNLAVVTGASRGIGRAISERFAREGARLALVGRSETQLKQARITAAQSAIACSSFASKRVSQLRDHDSISGSGSEGLSLRTRLSLRPSTVCFALSVCL